MYTICQIRPNSNSKTGLLIGGPLIHTFSNTNDLETSYFVQQTVFGSLSILAGFLTFFFPETNNTGHIHSLDEAEEFYKHNIPALKYFGCIKTSQHEE